MLRKSVFKLLLAITLTLIFEPSTAKAAWGDFDLTFGFGGTATDAVTGHRPRQVFQQPDGKILVTGYRNLISGGKGFFLRRYLSNGQLDTAFGKNGAAISPETNFIGSEYVGERIAVLPNGKIAAAGTANADFAVWQFTASGRNDTTFGQDGLRILSAYGGRRQIEINVQSGKLLIGMTNYTATSPVTLLRITSTGANDLSFGVFGEVVTNIGSWFFGTLVESSTGQIIVGGHIVNGNGQVGLDRRPSNGQPDPNFAAPPAPFYGFPYLYSLVKAGNGKFGIYTYQFDESAYLYRFSSASVYESILFFAGNAPTGICPNTFANQTDGKVIVTHRSRLARLNTALDFAPLEYCDCANLSGISYISRPALQTDDKMLVAGIVNENLVLKRLLPN